MNVVSELQQQILTVLRDAKTAGGSSYPKYIDPYEGQLRTGKSPTPAVYVDVTGSFAMNDESSAGDGGLWKGDFAPELVLFEENKASKKDNVSKIAELADWVIGAIKGKTITVNAVPIQLSDRIEGNFVSDYDEKKAAAVLKLPMATFE